MPRQLGHIHIATKHGFKLNSNVIYTYLLFTHKAQFLIKKNRKCQLMFRRNWQKFMATSGPEGIS